MPIQFRKKSIKSRKRTLGLAALGLIAETIFGHPKVDMAAILNVATRSQFAAAPLLASIGSLSWTASSESGATGAAASTAAGGAVVPVCLRSHRIDS